MSTSIKTKLAMLGVVAGLTAASGASFANSASAQAGSNTIPANAAPVFEQVDSIPMLTRPHSWQVIDEDTVIVWATAFDPYLVELAFKSNDLPFTDVIGVTQVGSRVYAK